MQREMAYRQNVRFAVGDEIQFVFLKNTYKLAFLIVQHSPLTIVKQHKYYTFSNI